MLVRAGLSRSHDGGKARCAGPGAATAAAGKPRAPVRQAPSPAPKGSGGCVRCFRAAVCPAGICSRLFRAGAAALCLRRHQAPGRPVKGAALRVSPRMMKYISPVLQKLQKCVGVQKTF